MSRTITVHLMGGLGNQMFEYAAARALALRQDARLYVDTVSGFVRDKVYKRTFELGAMPIAAEAASSVRRLPFWLSRARDRFAGGAAQSIQRSPWGRLVRETQARYMDEVATLRDFSACWMYGYWQCERYFEDAREQLARELSPPAPTESNFLALAEKMRTCESVAVGVRLFEEVPGASKEGVGGLTPMSFYDDAILQMVERVANPMFFVFCTTQSPQLRNIRFPGEVHFITHDNGFHGAIPRLWLITQCKHHILSNSSFYWWGAWLAERRQAGSQIIASDLYPNQDTVPARWRGR